MSEKYTAAELERMARAGCKASECEADCWGDIAAGRGAMMAARGVLDGTDEIESEEFRAAVLSCAATIDAERSPAGEAPGLTERLAADAVEWIVNDNAELGVKIGRQFFFLYKGHSLVYENGTHDDGTPIMWRPVGKREFGECCHPLRMERVPESAEFIAASGEWSPLLAPRAPVAGTPAAQPSCKHPSSRGLVDDHGNRLFVCLRCGSWMTSTVDWTAPTELISVAPPPSAPPAVPAPSVDEMVAGLRICNCTGECPSSAVDQDRLRALLATLDPDTRRAGMAAMGGGK